MSKPFVCYLFIFSLLFMGIESAVDSTGGEHPHGDEYVHVLDSGDPLLWIRMMMTVTARIVAMVMQAVLLVMFLL